MPDDRITLTGLRAFGHHGVLPSERVNGQEFIIDARVWFDSRPAAADDDLAKTINYADLADGIVADVQGDPVDLIETVAERLAQLVLDRTRAHRVEITVHKPSAPISVPFDDVAITITRERT